MTTQTKLRIIIGMTQKDGCPFCCTMKDLFFMRDGDRVITTSSSGCSFYYPLTNKRIFFKSGNIVDRLW